MASTAEKKGIVTNKVKTGPAPDSVKAAERQKKREERAAAAKRILAFLAENTDLPVLADIRLFVKQPGQRGRRKSNVLAQIAEMLATAGANGVSELVLFKQFHVGRKEMASMIRKAIMPEDADARLWIRFDADKEVYSLMGKGAVPPKGWSGFVPAENRETL